MSDFNVRSDAVNVEQIMEQIRAKIREKRGVDYTEQQISELATVKLEKFLDARGVRSDLLEQYRRAQAAQTPAAPPSFVFEADTLYASHRGPLRLVRRLLRPLLKLFFNPNVLIQALHVQSKLNSTYNARLGLDPLHYEVLHNLVLETTRLGIEVKNLKMRVESLTSRLEFNERRARALESVVVYKPEVADDVEKPTRAHGSGVARERDLPSGRAAQGSLSEPGPGSSADAGRIAEGPGQHSRRRRRRGRRGGTPAATLMAQPASEARPSSSVAAADPTVKSPAPDSDQREAAHDPTSSRAFGSDAQPAEPAHTDQASPSGSDTDQQ